MRFEEYDKLRTGDFVYYTPIKEDEENYEYPQIKKGVFMANLFGNSAAIKPIEEKEDNSCDIIGSQCVFRTEMEMEKFIKEVLDDRIYRMEEKIDSLSRKVEEYKRELENIN